MFLNISKKCWWLYTSVIHFFLLFFVRFFLISHICSTECLFILTKFTHFTPLIHTHIYAYTHTPVSLIFRLLCVTLFKIKTGEKNQQLEAGSFINTHDGTSCYLNVNLITLESLLPHSLKYTYSKYQSYIALNTIVVGMFAVRRFNISFLMFAFWEIPITVINSRKRPTNNFEVEKTASGKIPQVNKPVSRGTVCTHIVILYRYINCKKWYL